MTKRPKYGIIVYMMGNEATGSEEIENLLATIPPVVIEAMLTNKSRLSIPDMACLMRMIFQDFGGNTLIQKVHDLYPQDDGDPFIPYIQALLGADIPTVGPEEYSEFKDYLDKLNQIIGGIPDKSIIDELNELLEKLIRSEQQGDLTELKEILENNIASEEDLNKLGIEFRNLLVEYFGEDAVTSIEQTYFSTEYEDPLIALLQYLRGENIKVKRRDINTFLTRLSYIPNEPESTVGKEEFNHYKLKKYIYFALREMPELKEKIITLLNQQLNGLKKVRNFSEFLMRDLMLSRLQVGTILERELPPALRLLPNGTLRKISEDINKKLGYDLGDIRVTIQTLPTRLLFLIVKNRRATQGEHLEINREYVERVIKELPEDVQLYVRNVNPAKVVKAYSSYKQLERP